MSVTEGGAQKSYQLQQGGLHLSECFSQMLFCETNSSYFNYDRDQADVDHLLQKLILFPLPQVRQNREAEAPASEVK